MDSVSFASADESALRRVRSAGDVSPRPARARGSHRRSEGSGSNPNSATSNFGSLGESSLQSSALTPRNIPSPVDSMHTAQWDMPREELRPTTATPRQPAERTGWVGVVMTFLGYEGPGARARRELLSMLIALLSYFVQVST